MDNKQAAETLRTVAVAIPQFTDIDIPMADVAEAVERGADAIEMLGWLCSPRPSGVMNCMFLYEQWNGSGTFRDYCEARFRERAR